MNTSSPAAILDGMAETFRGRNGVYGDNYKNVANVVKALFPNGVPSDLVTTDSWHLFELIIVKLTRFANGNLRHRDSIHDAGVYCAMVESCVVFDQHQSPLQESVRSIINEQAKGVS